MESMTWSAGKRFPSRTWSAYFPVLTCTVRRLAALPPAMSVVESSPTTTESGAATPAEAIARLKKSGDGLPSRRAGMPVAYSSEATTAPVSR